MAALLVDTAWAYAAFGLAVAALFLTVGIGRVMEDAAGAYAFRPLLVPGIVLLWPVVLWRWWQLERGARWNVAAHRPPRRVQDGAALVLAALLPALVLAAFLVRQDERDAPAPMRIEGPDRAAP